MSLTDLVHDGIREFLNEMFDGSLARKNFPPDLVGEFYRQQQEIMDGWNASRQCIVPDCDNQAVKRSHTLQKSGPLKGISEENTVLTPRMVPSEFRVEMRQLNIASASTFPGFCQVHEGLFQKFETRKRLKDGTDFALQMYRSICREIHRMSNEVDFFRTNKKRYNNSMDEYYLAGILQKVRNAKVDFKEADVRDELEKLKGLRTRDGLQVLIDTREDDINVLRQKYLPILWRAISGYPKVKLPLFAGSLPFEIPVALSGLDYPRFQTTENEERRLVNIINIIPESGKTLVNWLHLPEDEQFMDEYMKAIGGQLPLLNMIESTMIYSTDHWFIRPSIWKRLPKNRKNAILRDILFCDSDSLQLNRHSIFDEVRRKLIEKFEQSTLTHERSSYEVEFISWEKSKLA